MKKITIILLSLVLVVSVLNIFVACEDEKEAIIKDYTIAVQNYAIGDEFKQDDVTITANLEDGTTRNITKNLIFVEVDDLKLDDSGKFTTAGTYTVKVYALEEREDLFIGNWTIKVA